MLTCYTATEGELKTAPQEETADRLGNAVWIDLLRPSPAEEQAVERALQLNVPTREEVQEIETSSRLYKERGALFMTAMVLSRVDSPRPEITPVTFVLAAERLITIRYEPGQPVTAFVARLPREERTHKTGRDVLLGLLDSIVDRAADILEQAGDNLNAISHEIFNRNEGPKRPGSLKDYLRRIGRNGDILSRADESLVSLTRLLIFLHQIEAKETSGTPDSRLEILERDVKSLNSHADSLSEKADFLLSATLGMVSIEQTDIIKIFSVAAVIFLPPTLVASIYGMNFDFMPELHWLFGYPFALLLMIVSAVLPYLFFKRRGWL